MWDLKTAVGRGERPDLQPGMGSTQLMILPGGWPTQKPSSVSDKQLV